MNRAHTIRGPGSCRKPKGEEESSEWIPEGKPEEKPEVISELIGSNKELENSLLEVLEREETLSKYIEKLENDIRGLVEIVPPIKKKGKKKV